MYLAAMKSSEANREFTGWRLERYCGSRALAFISSLLLGMFLTLILWQQVRHDELFARLAILVGTQAIQFWYANQFLSARRQGVDQNRDWVPGFLFAAILSGVGWFFSYFVLLQVRSDLASIFLLFSVAGVTAFAAVTKSSVPTLATAFECALLLPLATHLFMAGEESARYMGLAILIYLGAISFLLRYMGDIFSQNQDLTVENQQMNALLDKLKKLERDGAMFRSMIEMIADPAVIVHDSTKEGDHVYVNEAACRHFGVDRDTLMRLNPRDYDTRLTPEKLAAIVEGLQREGKYSFRTHHLRPDGREIPVEVSASRFEYEGEHLHVSFVQDISARLENEKRIYELELAEVRLENDKRFRHYLDSAPGMFFSIRREPDGRMRIPFVSGDGRLLFGLEQEQLAESVDGLLSVFHPEDVAALLEGLERSAREMCTYQADIRVATPNSAPLVVRLSVKPQASTIEPGVMEWHGFMHDITSQRMLEEQLQMKGYALDHSSEAMFLVDENGRFVYVNEQATRSLGYSRDELLKLPLNEIDTSFSAADQLAVNEAVCTKGEMLTFETTHRRKDGSTFPVEIQISHIEYCGQRLGLSLVRDITERKRVDRELIARESEFRALAENSPDVIFRYDKCCRRIYVNQAVEQLSGCARAEMIGKTPIEFTPLPSLNSVSIQGCIQRVLETTEKQELEAWFETADRSLVCIHHVFVPEYSAEGAVQTVLCLGRDITEVKLAEQKLKQRLDEIAVLNERLSTYTGQLEKQAADLEDSQVQLAQALELSKGVINAIPDILFEVDREGRYLNSWISNPEVPAEQKTMMLGKTVYEVLPFDAAEMAMRAIREADAHGRAAGAIIPIMQPDGETRWYEHSLAKKQGGMMDQPTFIVLSRDITERMKIEAELAAHERDFRSLVENVNDAVVRYDRNCRRKYVNPAWVRLNGVSAEEAIGKTPQQLSARIKPISKEFERMLKEVMETRCARNIDLNWVDERGEPVCYQLEAVPEFDANNEVVGVLTVARDISERKRMEIHLARREHEFRTLVENATDTVSRYGRDLRRQYANPAFAQKVQGGIEALLGKKPSEMPGGEFSRVYEEKLIEVLELGKTTEFELHWRDKEGHEVLSLIKLTPEFDPTGEVESVLAVGRDITELHLFRQKIHQMAFYDSLTSLPNRALFNDRLRQMVADASWHDQLAAVMMIDMDRFKEVNDTMGHAVGDELLCEAAARLNSCVRAYDTVARLGGDEFAILLPDIRSRDDLGRIASKMLDVFKVPYLLNGKEVCVSGSIGIALFPDDSMEGSDLLKYADSAMYHAKRSGRNSFRFYSRELTLSANERLALEADLRHAISRQELMLYYQPKVSLRDGRITGSEALLRWNHATRGMIPPDKFISIAEDCGIIIEIGKWVLLEACHTATRWNGKDRPLHKVAVNLSARQFQGHLLIETLQEVLKQTACKPEWLELEITESLLLEEDDHVLETLNDLRSMGITIAIDDFGTGYSALSYLAKFPITTLKIDRSFITAMESEHYRAELVKAILSIAKCLKQEVVAEGVETGAQAEFLRAHGCQTVQGYLFSKPLPRHEFEQLAERFVLFEQ